MKRHALFVGVDQYADEHIQDLRCAVNDATDLAGFFKHRARFDRAEALANPRNCEAILDRVYDMIRGLGDGDEFLFFFAGHGIKTPDGHRLVCAGDKLNAVKHSWAGLPLERIKSETSGAFNRLFLLDACRTDVLATNRGAVGAMEEGTRDLILGTATSADEGAGALTILCSCNDGECAGEILKHRHGLFSMAMLELLEEECSRGRRVLVTDDFVYNQIPARMRTLAEKSDMAFNQKPQKEGPPILILGGESLDSVVHTTSSSDDVVSPTLVKCPVCGRWRNKTETFDCSECGCENICIDHQDEKSFLCADCTAKRVREEAERQTAYIRMNTRRAIEEGDNGNYGKAYEFAQKADLNNAAIQGIIGYALVNGIGCDRDVQRGIDWWLKAAMQGSAPFQYNLGVLYFEGKDVGQDDLEAVKWFKKAAENGYAPAQASLASCYECARGVPKSESAAIAWCRKAAEKGFAPAQYNMGVLYYNGCNAITKDEAQKWLKMVAAKGNDEATKLLGLIEERGRRSQQQSVSDKEAYEKGKNYYYGRNGFTQSFADAVECFRSAAELGHAWAQCYLGTCYMHGEGVNRDEKEAVKWYRRAADAGNDAAQCFVANCYMRGQGVSKNDEEAVKWYRKAADEENATAQCNLGNCYYIGKGVALDYMEAVEWYRRAVAKENAIAQNCLGLCYEKGHGVTQDYSEAANMYRKSIANGNERAKESLARVEQMMAASLKTKTIRISRNLVPPTSSGGDCGEVKSVVVLEDCGNDKIAVIREIRAIKGMGLAEAKKLVESVPVAIVRDAAMSECRRIAQQLEKAGARVHYSVASSHTRTLGNTLRDARLAKGYYSSEQLAAKAKIPTELVRDLENDDFHRIVAPIYGRGFVKLYAECVGLDPVPLIEKFMTEYNAQKS